MESLFLEKKGTKWRQINRWTWDMIILDESQSFKSQSSYRFKALRRLRKLCASLCQLTGTPAPNGYDDLWSQLYLLDGGQRLCPSQT
ncbi:SNF2-related protein, partial [Acinetobacter baumannii]